MDINILHSDIYPSVWQDPELQFYIHDPWLHLTQKGVITGKRGGQAMFLKESFPLAQKWIWKSFLTSTEQCADAPSCWNKRGGCTSNTLVVGKSSLSKVRELSPYGGFGSRISLPYCQRIYWWFTLTIGPSTVWALSFTQTLQINVLLGIQNVLEETTFPYMIWFFLALVHC